MIHIGLCLLAVLLAWRTEQARPVALLYGGIQGLFWLIRSPAAEYGDAWFILVASVEAATAISLIGIDTMPAKFVRWASWSAVCINLATLPHWSPLYGVYPYLIPCSEYARVACIIVFSNPIWAPLQGWYDRRQAKKDTTWLARWTPEPR